MHIHELLLFPLRSTINRQLCSSSKSLDIKQESKDMTCRIEQPDCITTLNVKALLLMT